MFTSTYTRPLGKVMVMLFSMALLCVMSIGSPVASAQVIQKASAPAAHQSISHGHGVQPHSFTPCTPTHGSYFDIFCISPSVSVNKNCGYPQYYKATDNNGQPVDYTYTDELHTCVYVSFSFTFTRHSCDVYFYVPNGFGDADFHYSVNVSVHFYHAPIDESITSGFYEAFAPSASGIMSFNDTQSPAYKTLGWGTASSDGIQEICTN